MEGDGDGSSKGEGDRQALSFRVSGGKSSGRVVLEEGSEPVSPLAVEALNAG